MPPQSQNSTGTAFFLPPYYWRALAIRYTLSASTDHKCSPCAGALEVEWTRALHVPVCMLISTVATVLDGRIEGACQLVGKKQKTNAEAMRCIDYLSVPALPCVQYCSSGPLMASVVTDSRVCVSSRLSCHWSGDSSPAEQLHWLFSVTSAYVGVANPVLLSACDASLKPHCETLLITKGSLSLCSYKFLRQKIMCNLCFFWVFHFSCFSLTNSSLANEAFSRKKNLWRNVTYSKSRHGHIVVMQWCTSE